MKRSERYYSKARRAAAVAAVSLATALMLATWVVAATYYSSWLLGAGLLLEVLMLVVGAASLRESARLSRQAMHEYYDELRASVRPRL